MYNAAASTVFSPRLFETGSNASSNSAVILLEGTIGSTSATNLSTFNRDLRSPAGREFAEQCLYLGCVDAKRFFGRGGSRQHLIRAMATAKPFK